ncbi:hypothetical protein [Limosilactobacillus galli]|uniref:hypothetical protein n=1 Tax=Limosilactobacillus galli TaxID=2991834 RepID=UPI0024BB6C22|nr:hypothetical protein [Limosilactobacillus galli]
MKYKDAIKAAKDGALITDGEHVYKIIGPKTFSDNLPGFIIQRQTRGVPFDEIDVDPITVTNIGRLKK